MPDSQCEESGIFVGASNKFQMGQEKDISFLKIKLQKGLNTVST
jgi:hypothetical protein